MCEQMALPSEPAFVRKVHKGLKTPNAFINSILESDDYGQSFGVEDWADDYAEPGYTKDSEKCILFGNWNDKDIRVFDDGLKQYVNKGKDLRPKRFSKIAEHAGYTLEWSDEWSKCDDCGKAFRTSPDSYGWSPAYAWIGESSMLCRECVIEDPTEYLEEISGDYTRCISEAMARRIDLASQGYTKNNAERYESGLHPGQNDNPEAIAKELQTKGYTDYIFVQDVAQQFDTYFSVWVKAPEAEEEES